MKGSFVERFWSRVSAPDAHGCRVWTGHCSKSGYGRVRLPGQNQQQAHRVAWTLTNGVIPEGLHVLHRCDNPPCVEPSHLFLGTQADNIADRDQKGRRSERQRYTGRKLSERAVATIRQLAAEGIRQSTLAGTFGVDPSTVSRIVNARTWR